MKKRRLWIGVLAFVICGSLLAGCTMDTSRQSETGYLSSSENEEEEKAEDKEKTSEESEKENLEEDTGTDDQEDESMDEDGQNEDSSDGDDQENSSEESSKIGYGRHIVIDPGHQETVEDEDDTEPIGPGGEETKARITTGSLGVNTGIEECEINLEVAYWLKEELEDRGYEVVLTRDTNDVDMSNAERAELANSIDPTAFIRIHADAGTDPETNGIMAICMTAQNPYNGYLFEQSYELSSCILENTLEETGATNLNIWQTDTMTGINYSTVPVCQLQVGYLSNADDEAKLMTTKYQKKLAKGIANGIDDYVRVITSGSPETVDESGETDDSNGSDDTDNANGNDNTNGDNNTNETDNNTNGTNNSNKSN